MSGKLLPDSVVDEILEQMGKPLAFGSIGFDPNRPPPPRPSFRRRMQIRLDSARWWFHNRLFPDCHSDDY